MIGLLRGSVIELEGNLALIDVGGVGYEVTVPQSAIPKLAPNAQVTLYVRQIIRETDNFLCGFLDRSERNIFDLLLDAKGCGPKVATALIGQVGAEAVVGAIVTADAKTLTKASGVGVRLAERIIVELRPKLEGGAFVLGGVATPAVLNSPDRDLIDALTALGYRRAEIDSVLTVIEPDSSTDKRLKQALGLLKKS